MADATLTPDRVADHIAGLSADIRACVLLDADGRLVAVDEAHEADGQAFADLARGLLERAGTPQVEVSTGIGIVYAISAGGWIVAAVTGRFALSSLVFYDLRRVLGELA
jgi:hypothetical protein